MLEVIDIHKDFGRKKVLRGVSFTADKGDITCLIGINGVGKTTILNSIMNLTPIKKGKILVDGQAQSPELYNKITFIPDASIMLPGMTVQEAIDFMKDYYSAWNDKRAKDLIRFFRLKTTDKIQDLSKGNQAKVNLLVGLSLDVDYILMDEPFSGIDIFTREQIAEVFSSRLVEDRGVLITTHEIADIEHLIDKVVLLDDGLIIKEFYAEEMREKEGMSVVDVMREAFNV
ncbi:ATP-binding cassette domain-containing protein [Marinilactibacillus psychrotolerans]|uniref:ABC transporter ATP-binding protein n=2 Tax=Marinilactibacillus psychrotolerans TaxID=191770 RepID=A0AAV3WVQ9_9LACT|nr:ABC transporter ATP-binding protein [Marinilactibacillus psychrotolerans]SDD16226.1 ABC-2 type transport system ATP-binding protein [Marinilactibacillus psychrotolerans]SJN24336.1 ABC transporter ATP-binding protein [Marinilactibacillus psychrotolerans 42ea]GEL66406.1 multidrug ABC transporter ATP-binding protein [Marinilactibacillus psychrotolerans]GEQ33409.1 ABC transporter ATP-binding protein [Marinilactibacillus psychrotolerans]GEQ36728.1 ABC transporter ATP-binding protein [Marinilacti